MAIREILLHPRDKKALRLKSKPVPKIDWRVKQLIRDLKDTLAAHTEGVGLAAPQIDTQQRVMIVCLGNETDGEWQAGPPIALVNPEIVEAHDERKDFDGCLSFPGLSGETSRPHYLRVTGLDEEGQPIDRIFEGFDAVLIHHEIDHLNGVLFIDLIENPEDLYRIRENEIGEFMRVPAIVI